MNKILVFIMNLSAGKRFSFAAVKSRCLLSQFKLLHPWHLAVS